MKKQALFCMLLAGTLMVGGCGQKAVKPVKAAIREHITIETIL